MAKHNDSPPLFPDESTATLQNAMTCLGMTFENDEKRRDYFLEKLREKLQNPEFRKIEGFPIGSDEDILSLSDPPYYTVCPNPWVSDFIAHWDAEKRGLRTEPEDKNSQPYHRESFAVDVSEGKTDPIYKAHSYHTKVPHLAIVPSILHYTEPGDVVLDGFCGSGMTGVAAQWCGCAPEAYRQTLEMSWEKEGLEKPKWGARRVILNDLSPAATFMAANYNLPFDVRAFAEAGKRLLNEVEQELGWMYETLHVEPASSRLMEKTHFKPAGSRLHHTARDDQQDIGPTGISQFTARQDSLPHWQEPGSTYFLTFKTSSHRILSDRSKDCILQALQFWHGQRLLFIAAAVMPDHVHTILHPLEKSPGVCWDLAVLLHSIKSFSANEINKIENTIGQPVWQTETYDRIIRDEREYGFVLQYIAYNPVKAGLARSPEEYPWFKLGAEVLDAGWKPAPLGRIEYTVWSEVFTCPNCAGEVVFLDEALDAETKRVKDSFPCPHCEANLTKDNMERVFETRPDPANGKPWKRVKYRPSLVSYMVGRQRYEKPPDTHDLHLLDRIIQLPLPAEIPTNRFPIEQMYHGSRIEPKGFTHVHHFFLPRPAHALAALWRKANAHPDVRIRHMLLFFVEQAIWGLSVLNRYGPLHFSQVNRYLTGVYYIASQHAECSPWYILSGKLDRLSNAFKSALATKASVTITTGTAVHLSLPDASIDYVFTDPPFGENIYYADLNFLVESWHRVITDAAPEAIVDKFKKKGLSEYQYLMQKCFEEYYRVLKPGRWMTVVFHNSRNAVWNAIQEAMQAAGFVVADVRTLDKQQGSYRQVTSSAVKQDLVISVYKPNGGLEQRFKLTAGTEDGVWDFVRTHLQQLPAFVSKDGQAEVIAERQNYLLFDRVVAFHVQRGVTIPLAAAEFYAGLEQRFPTREGMYFLPDQVAEYDKKRMTVREILQLELYVIDESSAIQWLKQQITRKPQTFQELHPQFIKKIGGWQKHEKPLELSALLEQNFLRYDGRGEVSSQIHSYLSTNFKELRNLPKDDESLRSKGKDRWYVPDPNKAGDLEKLREKSLLKEFEEYRAFSQKRLKVFRLEAARAGFKKAWQERDYTTIIAVARKIPDNILQEDAKMLMWYDQALTRSGGDL